MCVEYCFIHSGCVAIYYNAEHLVCHLLTRAVICKNKKEKKRLMFSDLKDWTMDESLCWPNPCNMHQKCVIVDQMYPICVRFQPTLAHIPETEEITTSRTSTEPVTNTDASSTGTEIFTTSKTSIVNNNSNTLNNIELNDVSVNTSITSQETSTPELVTYIKCNNSRNNEANETSTMIYNYTTDSSVMAATNVSTVITSGITEFTIANNDTPETETTTEQTYNVKETNNDVRKPTV
ncbi:unnamed protein product [Mytilus coruscus]|uniref:Uncharacterized protein n=1 Tax=Mytilus coruscus TaxID=42192 RepID=A0A6J8F140_MYTCO|nr:unnamed protein product [Mytilus coruscus]